MEDYFALNVIGTATGASIWASDAPGHTIGFGFPGLAVSLFLLVFCVPVGGSLIAGHINTRRD